MKRSKPVRHALLPNAAPLVALVVALGMLAPAQVLAQSPQGRGEPGRGEVLEEVLVTALKREQTVQDIPVSIAVVSGDNLRDFAVDNLFEVANFAPGMVLSRAPDDGIALTFRGIGTPARNQSFESSVGVFMDGLFFGKGRMLTPSFFDVERIEFLKGTQSTLLGKNTSVGAISIVNNSPGDAFGGDASIRREFVDGGWAADGAVDLPASERAKFRLAAHYKDQDGWVKNSATGREGPNDEDFGARLTGAFEITDDLDVTARYQYSDSSRLGNAWQPVTPSGVISGPGYPNGPVEARFDDRTAQYMSAGKDGESYHEQKTHLASVLANLASGDHSFSSQTTYATYEMSNLDEFDFEVADFNYLARGENYHQLTQEFRLASATGGKLDYLAGLYYLHGNWQSVELQHWGVPNLLGPPEIPVPPFPDRALFNGDFVNDFTQRVDSYSAFVHGTLHVTDAFSVTAGVRYTDESKDVEFGRTAIPPLHFWNTGANPPFPRTPLEFDDEFVNGNLNLQYEFSPDVMMYASYGRGTKLGGFAESTSVPDANPAVSALIRSETTQTYELGTKTSLLSGTLNVNGAIFYSDVEDYQQTTFINGAFVTDNVPARSRGAEIETSWRIAAPLRVSFAAVYADAIDTSTDMTLTQAPKWTINAGWSYEHDIGDALAGRFSGHARYRSRMFNQIGESAPSESWTTLDLVLGIGAADGRWDVALVGTNVTDAESADFGGDSPDPTTCAVAAGCQLYAMSQLRNISLQVKSRF